MLFVVAAAAAASVRDPTPVTPYKLNLDVAPEHRYDELVPIFLPRVLPLIQWIRQFLPAIVWPAVDEVLAVLDDVIGEPYADEMRGIARAANVSLGDVVLMNIFYELTAGCTSIVAVNANGTTLHGRNLDFMIPGLSTITIDLVYYSGGSPVYRGTTFGGMVGLLTGKRMGATPFSVSLDERDPTASYDPTGIVHVILSAISALLGGGRVASFAIRDTLADPSMSFSSAVDALAAVPLVAPAYLIVGGPGAGAVVTRDRESAVDVWRMDPQAGVWYLLETNYDHWVPPPPDDDRRDPGNQHMNQTGVRNIGVGSLYWVLTQPPTFNGETDYTTVMEVNGDAYSTVEWP